MKSKGLRRVCDLVISRVHEESRNLEFRNIHNGLSWCSIPSNFLKLHSSSECSNGWSKTSFLMTIFESGNICYTSLCSFPGGRESMALSTVVFITISTCCTPYWSLNAYAKVTSAGVMSTNEVSFLTIEVDVSATGPSLRDSARLMSTSSICMTWCTKYAPRSAKSHPLLATLRWYAEDDRHSWYPSQFFLSRRLRGFLSKCRQCIHTSDSMHRKRTHSSFRG